MRTMIDNHLPASKAAGKAFMQACYFLEVMNGKSDEANWELLEASVYLIQEVRRLEQIPIREELQNSDELEPNELTEFKMYES